MPWYENTEIWATVGSVGALIISLVALYGTYRRQAEQRMREKREELRGAVERLITLREEQNRLNEEQDEREKATAAVYQNQKRRIYLEAAETLAREIPNDVSAAEYILC
jgi:flagellar biosynthesis/type III secretory pathway M-ring protein FliF/YscJ